jgi:predicted enzyme related to lactoylglutathione lyase
VAHGPAAAVVCLQRRARCDNVERTYEELKGRGVPFTAAPQKQPWGTFAVFTDPGGNQFVLSSRT